MNFKFDKVPVFKKMDDPYQTGYDKYVMYVNIFNFWDKELFDWTKTNPRLQEDSKSKEVYKEIKKSLERGLEDFHRKNKGILFFAESISYDNQKKEVILEFVDPELHGNVDGGHTMKIIHEYIKEVVIKEIINKYKNEYNINVPQNDQDQYDFLKKHINDTIVQHEIENLANGFVSVEVMVNLDKNQVSETALTRNTSVQVDDKSIQDLKKKFENLKTVLMNNGDNRFGKEIANRLITKQGQRIENGISVDKITTLLYAFLTSSDIKSKFYNSGLVIPKKFIEMLDEYDKNNSPDSKPGKIYNKVSNLLLNLIKLYDKIEIDLVESKKFTSKKYGAKPFAKKGEKEKSTTLFSLTPLKHKTHEALIKPLIYAFKTLIGKDENDNWIFNQNPIDVWESTKAEMIESILNFSEKVVQNNLNKLGKSDEIYELLSQKIQIWVYKSK